MVIFSKLNPDFKKEIERIAKITEPYEALSLAVELMEKPAVIESSDDRFKTITRKINFDGTLYTQNTIHSVLVDARVNQKVEESLRTCGLMDGKVLLLQVNKSSYIIYSFSQSSSSGGYRYNDGSMNQCSINIRKIEKKIGPNGLESIVKIGD